MSLDFFVIKSLLEQVLAEDIGGGDLTTDNLFTPLIEGKAEFLAKETGIVAGLPVAQMLYQILDPRVKWQEAVHDGQQVYPGTVLARVEGSMRSILTGERTALNFLQRLSAIATKTNSYVDLVSEYNVRILDTRKTTPGLRILEKYAVKVGGGTNHRFNLSDAVLLKDNHIKAAGSLTEAVQSIKKQIPVTAKIEVEVETLEQVREALDNKVDIIMLDNMSVSMMKKAVELIDGRVLVEASGGINKENILEVAATGVNLISIGELTHTVKALDISLEVIK